MSDTEAKWATWIWDVLRPGQRFERRRGFKPAETSEWDDDDAPAAKWWVVGTRSMREATARGTEVIEVIEVVDTATVGALVLYRQWLVDPDGVEVDNILISPRRKQLLFRAETKLRGSLNAMGFKAALPHRPALRVV